MACCASTGLDERVCPCGEALHYRGAQHTEPSPSGSHQGQYPGATTLPSEAGFLTRRSTAVPTSGAPARLFDNLLHSAEVN